MPRRSRSVPALGALAIVAALGLAACTDPSPEESGSAAPASQAPSVDATAIPPPAPGEATEFKGQGISSFDLERLGKRATRALRTRDVDAYLELFDPRDDELRREQRTWFRNIQRVPMEHLAMITVRQGNLLDSSGTRELHAVMGFEHQISGADTGRVTEWYRFGLDERGKQIVVTDVGPAPTDSGSYRKFAGYYRQAWDDGPISVVQGSRSILLGPAGDESLLRSRVAQTDAAVRAVSERLRRAGALPPGFGGDRKFVFTLPAASVADMHDYFGGRVTPTEAEFAGFATPIFRSTEFGEVDTTVTAAGTRIVLDRDLWTSGRGLDSVLRHELVHAAQDSWQSTLDSTPRWVVEGLAVYFSDAPATELSQRRSHGRAWFATQDQLPDETMYEGSDQEVAQHYGAGYLAIAYLADRYGEKKVLTALQESESGDRAPGFLEALGVDPDELGTEVRAWLG